MATCISRAYSINKPIVGLHPQDVVAMTSTPLPGYLVATATEIDGITRDNVFKLFHSGMKKVYFFQAEDKGHLMRYYKVYWQPQQSVCETKTCCFIWIIIFKEICVIFRIIRLHPVFMWICLKFMENCRTIYINVFRSLIDGDTHLESECYRPINQ